MSTGRRCREKCGANVTKSATSSSAAIRRTNHWIRLNLTVPKEWRDKEMVQLECDPSCEVSRTMYEAREAETY